MRLSLSPTFIAWVLSLLPAVTAVSVSSKPDDENRKNFISEADKLYSEHSYKKLRDMLLQFKVYLTVYIS